MGTEHVEAVDVIWVLVVYHSTSIPPWCIMVEWQYISVVRLLFIPWCHLAKKIDRYIATKWPWKLIVKFPTHQAYVYRDMRAFTLTITIGVNLQVHLVALKVGVERGRKPTRTVPPICIKSHHYEVDRSHGCAVECLKVVS